MLGKLAALGLPLQLDPQRIANAERDFGGLEQGVVRAVVEPRSEEELAQLLRSANQHGWSCTLRGRGMSQGGQSLPRDGISVSTARLDHLLIGDGEARAGAGVTIRQISLAAAQQGQQLSVMPLNPDMSLGGLLAVGGIGSRSHREGLLVSQVRRLRVVTGAGEIVACMPEDSPARAVLGGVGRAAAITEATLALRPLARSVETTALLYDDFAALLADAAPLIGSSLHLECFFWLAAKGPHPSWIYALHVSSEDGEDAGRLARLEPWRRLAVDRRPGLDFIFRFQPRFDALVKSGEWQQPHPWLETVLPAGDVARRVPGWLAAAPPALGDGHRLMWVNLRNAPALWPRPQGEVAACFAILPTGVREAASMRASLAVFGQSMRDEGAKRYLSGWLGDWNASAWADLHGERLPAVEALARELDPRGVLTSQLF